MSQRRTVYAWTAGTKFYLSIDLPGDVNGYRPRNEYDTREALLAEAAQRRLRVIWEWDNAATE